MDRRPGSGHGDPINVALRGHPYKCVDGWVGARKGAHMSQKPPTRAMRENPDIDQLKRQAKELFEAYRSSSPEAVAEVTAYHRTATPETFALHDAQFVLARSYGFESRPK